jgi:hypothetical protein
MPSARRSPKFSLGELVVPKAMGYQGFSNQGFGIVVKITYGRDYYTYYVRFQKSQRLINYSQGGLKFYGS